MRCSKNRVHFANSSPTRESQMTDSEDPQHTPEDYDMLRISPNEFIHFSRGQNNESNVELTCISKLPVTYKIQTTSPEKFRVRPRCGVLIPGETIPVSILLKSEHHLAEGSKDKFLVMCMRAASDNMTPQQVTEMWKQKVANTPEVEQHRLCCIYKDASEPASLRNGVVSSGGEVGSDVKGINTVADLSKHAKHLEDQLKFTQLLQCLTLVFLLALSVAVVYLLKLETGSTTAAAEASAVPSAPSTPACTKGRFI